MKQYKNKLLAPYTSLRVGGPANELIVIEKEDNLEEQIKKITNKKLCVLGGGTNSLISDEGLAGIVILNQSGSIRLTDTIVAVDSGVNWDELVQFSIENNLYGFELMSGIPGSTGGAVIGNIAAYGQKIADTFISAQILDLTTQQVTTFDTDAMQFSYRNSRLSGNQELVVLSAKFNLSRLPTMQLEYQSALSVAKDLRLVPHSLANRRSIIMETRKRAGSLQSIDSKHATAGSFFKNPLVNQEQVDSILVYEETGVSKAQLLRQNQLHSGDSIRVSAAHVLLAAGFKRGQTWGSVRLHPDHILKLENTGNAKAQEIHDVVHFITGTVKSKLSIDLEPEVKFLGTFN